MEGASEFGPMEHSMRGIGRITSQKAMGGSFTKMGTCTRASGIKERLMGKVFI
jgi:hypothetical protein